MYREKFREIKQLVQVDTNNKQAPVGQGRVLTFYSEHLRMQAVISAGRGEWVLMFMFYI